MDGSGTFADPQFLEVSGLDLGAIDPANNGNFGFGQLVVGDIAQATVVELIDVLDNANRQSPEALYLFGLGGPDGLHVLGGSTLVMNHINVYAFIGGQLTHLNALFGSDLTIPFDQGFLRVPEPSMLFLVAVASAFSLQRRRRRNSRPPTA